MLRFRFGAEHPDPVSSAGGRVGVDGGGLPVCVLPLASITRDEFGELSLGRVLLAALGNGQDCSPLILHGLRGAACSEDGIAAGGVTLLLFLLICGILGSCATF